MREKEQPEVVARQSCVSDAIEEDFAYKQSEYDEAEALLDDLALYEGDDLRELYDDGDSRRCCHETW